MPSSGAGCGEFIPLIPKLLISNKCYYGTWSLYETDGGRRPFMSKKRLADIAEWQLR